MEPSDLSIASIQLEPISPVITWNVVSKNEPLTPRNYGNGKTQVAVAEQCLQALNSGMDNAGKAFVLLKGPPGSGKSLIALSMAQQVQKTIIVVPKKNLQDQYNDDYSENFDSDGALIEPRVKIWKNPTTSLSISTDKGRGNFTCRYAQEKHGGEWRASNKNLPCTRTLVSGEKRKDVGSLCPYWAPISQDEDYLPDSSPIEYDSIKGPKFIHQREPGCTYYTQFTKNLQSDVTIINNKKFLLECAMGRLPAADLLVIDEVDLFLDELKSEYTIDISALKKALLTGDQPKYGIINILEKIEEYATKQPSLEPLQMDGTKERIEPLLDLIKEVMQRREIYAEDPYLEDLCNNLSFYSSFSTIVWATFETKSWQGDNNLKVTLFVLEVRHLVDWLLTLFPRILGMSATIHRPNVLQHIYGIGPELYGGSIITSTDDVPGTLNLCMLGTEFKCNKAFMATKRDEYLKTLNECIKKSRGQTLVHVIAYSDLPSSHGGENIPSEVISKEELQQAIRDDNKGERMKNFKNKKVKVHWSTSDMRGTDLPGELCTNIVFTKAPYPNPTEPFYKALAKSNDNMFWEYYNDKMERELIQGVSRGLRSEKDVVNLYSPDSRIFRTIQDIAIRSLRS